MIKSKIRNILSCSLALTVLLITFSACASGEDNQNNSHNGSSDISAESELLSDENSAYINPLTGLEISSEKINSRPVAVMINNISQAQPLLGVSKADILYECLVEGGITRIEAIYKDISSVKSVGSIRSARPPFITLARGLDAIYVCCGTSTQAEELLSQNVIDCFDLQNYTNLSFRDEWRQENLGFEHSLLSSGELISNGIKNESMRSTTNLSYNQKFSSDSQINNGMSAQKINVNFSGYKFTDFKYDYDKNTYLVYQYGEPMNDSVYDVQNTADNVLVLHVDTKEIDDEGHIMLELIGNGDGYYASNGKYIPIKWSKESEDTPIQYKTTDGNDLVMTAGRQYICCIPISKSVTFE